MTQDYRNRINQIAEGIKHEPEMRKMRDDISEGIKSTGNRQADVEEQFQEVIENTTGKDVISAPEIIAARKGEPSLDARITKQHQQVTAQLAQIMNQKPHSLLSLDRPTFVAHRGLSRLAPENTVKSLELASAKGFDWVEIDISETSDNQLVLMHDRTVDRTTDGSGETRSLTLNQIQGLTIDGGNNIDKYPGLKVPTLDNVLKVCKSLGLKVIAEIKYVSPENFESLVDLIRKHDMESDCIILVSYILYIQDFRELSNNIAVMYLDTNVKQEIVNSLAGVSGSVGLSLQTGGFTEEDVKSLQSKGIFVNVWTVNSYESVNTYKKWGIDLITTDFISEVKN